MSLFKTNTIKHYSKLTRINNVYKDGKNPRKTKIEKQLENKVIRDIKRLFEQEEDYYKPMRAQVIFGVMVIKAKTLQSKNTQIRLNHT